MVEARELIERLEGAACGSRELDMMIHAFDHGWSYPLIGAAREEFEQLGRESGNAYSTSLDVALTLVPESCVWNLAGPHWQGGPDGHDAFGADCGEFIGTADYPENYGRTPALALCIAALRARADEPRQTEPKP